LVRRWGEKKTVLACHGPVSIFKRGVKGGRTQGGKKKKKKKGGIFSFSPFAEERRVMQSDFTSLFSCQDWRGQGLTGGEGRGNESSGLCHSVGGKRRERGGLSSRVSVSLGKTGRKNREGDCADPQLRRQQRRGGGGTGPALTVFSKPVGVGGEFRKGEEKGGRPDQDRRPGRSREKREGEKEKQSSQRYITLMCNSVLKMDTCTKKEGEREQSGYSAGILIEGANSKKRKGGEGKIIAGIVTSLILGGKKK